MSPQDAEASLRAELSGQIAAAQSTIENQLAALRDAAIRSGDSSAVSQAQAQLQGLAQLQKQVAQANVVGLAGMRGEVAATVATAQSIAQRAKETNGAAQNAQAMLYETDQEARRTTASFLHDYYDKQIFDKYLHFANEKDEEEFRTREAERREEIEKARAEHTPEGDLRALELSRKQLLDAGAHGADQSPDYQPMLHGLETSRDKLAACMQATQATTIKTERETAATTDSRIKSVSADAGAADLIAQFQAQVTLADQGQDGHGLTATKVIRSADVSATPSH